MTGSRAQWYNGMLLLASFLGCRLLWGTYQSARVYRDVWIVMRAPQDQRLADMIIDTFQTDAESRHVMQHLANFDLPHWLVGVYLASNIALNSLNFYWYSKMIRTVLSRFQHTGQLKATELNESAKKDI